MINEKDQVKIMDFGLAKLKGQTKITKEGSTLGTAAYMSPEQARGADVDHRTDIWSLGVVLYEMITGQLPFKGEYEQAVMYSILNEEPEPVTALRTGIPLELERIVNKTLAKDPSERYQHADDLIVDLRKLKKQTEPEMMSATKSSFIEPRKKSPKIYFITGALMLAVIIVVGVFFIFKGKQETEKPVIETEEIIETKWKNSVAVLPFRDFSPQKDQRYFCDGMTDAIIGKLSHLKQLKIISLTSVLQYKNQARNIKRIGEELSVETILEGSIQKEGNRIRVNAQLINVADDSHLWQNTYEQELKSLFSIQDEITESIVNALRIELLKEEKELLSKHHTQNMDAFKLYMQGRFFWRKRSRQGHNKSIEFYNQALQVDPNYAMAYSGLADVYSVMAWNRFIPQKEGFARAKESALKALELNDRLAEAHNSLALILLDHEWQFEKAQQEFEKAIQYNPGYAAAYHWYSRYFIYQGDLDKAFSLLKQALKLDPLSPSFHYSMAGLYAWDGHYDQAIAIAKKGLDLHPDFSPLHDVLGMIYCEKSMFAEALDEFKRILDPTPYKQEYYILYIDLKKGNMEALEKLQGVINQLETSGKPGGIFPSEIARLYGIAGKPNKYFEWLEKAYEQRDPWILSLRVWPWCPQCRSDPRFKNLLKKIGLEK